MMKTTSLAIAGAAGLAALCSAPLAFGQAKPSPAAAQARPGAAPAAAAQQAPTAVITATVPGICVLSREGIVGTSTVGKYVQTRLGQLTSQAQAEIAADQTSLQNDAKAFDAKKATLTQAAQQQQVAALQQRDGVLQQKAQQRDRELQATEQKAVAKVLQEASPFVADLVKSKNCAVVFDANGILAVNQVMDLTGGVVTALNGKLTQFDFDRERLDAQAAGPQR
jgi:outer membrane protein